MKIGIDGRLWNETGVGRYVRMLFKYLPELDTENEYVWFLGEKEFNSLEMPSPKWCKVKTNIHWHTFAEQIFLPFIFLKENLDLLHFPYFTFPILYPKKFVVTIHDLIFDHYKTGKTSTLPPWFYAVKKLGYHLVNWISVFRAEKIFTLSNDAKNELIDHYRADPNKVVVTYEAGTLEDTKVKSDRPKQFQPYILYVGNAHPHKNVESLIKAIEILNTKSHSGKRSASRISNSLSDSGPMKISKDFQGKPGQNDVLKLVLVGYDRFFYPRLPKSKYVQVIGEVPNSEIAAWYKYAAAFVTASKMEGFGIPPLEAMTMGCPVILSDIPIFHEINGDAAIYFDPNDPKDIAKTIKETLADKALLKNLVARGYEQAAKYSWKKCVIQTEKIYENCLSLRSDQ